MFPSIRSVSQLNGVCITCHVIVKHHAAHACQLHCPRLKWKPSALLKFFGTSFNLLTDGFRTSLVKTPILPMPMRRKDHWERPLPFLWTVQTSRHIVAGNRLKKYTINHIIITFDSPMNHCIQWCSSRKWPESLRYQNPTFDFDLPLFPCSEIGYGFEGKKAIESLQFAQPVIFRGSALKHRWCLSVSRAHYQCSKKTK